MNDKIPLIFQAQITQNSPMENSGFTLCRARVFYTGLNRNGSYIDKEFAEEISTAYEGSEDYEKMEEKRVEEKVIHTEHSIDSSNLIDDIIIGEKK